MWANRWANSWITRRVIHQVVHVFVHTVTPEAASAPRWKEADLTGEKQRLGWCDLTTYAFIMATTPTLGAPSPMTQISSPCRPTAKLPDSEVFPALRLGAKAIQRRTWGNDWEQIAGQLKVDLPKDQVHDLALFTAAFFPSFSNYGPEHAIFCKPYNEYFGRFEGVTSIKESRIYAVLWGHKNEAIHVCVCGAILGQGVEAAVFTPAYVANFSHNDGLARLFAADELMRAFADWLIDRPDLANS